MRQTTRNAEHYFTATHVGPYVVLQCCCGWSLRKVKQFSAECVTAAKAHVRANTPERPKNKYDDCMGERGTKLYAAYKRKQLQFHTTTDVDMIHGGNLMQRTPRNQKHQRLVVAGLRVK